MSDSEKSRFVADIIQALGLQADAIIGSVTEGLGLEQRKLLSIAVELASKPDIIFLDEPTSGLDSQSALRIVLLLQRLAEQGVGICATVHQPVKSHKPVSVPR